MIFSMHLLLNLPLHIMFLSLLLKLHWTVIYVLFLRQDIFLQSFETSDGLYYFATAQTIDRLRVNVIKRKIARKRQILSLHLVWLQLRLMVF